jgi:hypothetical protein
VSWSLCRTQRWDAFDIDGLKADLRHGSVCKVFCAHGLEGTLGICSAEEVAPIAATASRDAAEARAAGDATARAAELMPSVLSRPCAQNT